MRTLLLVAAERREFCGLLRHLKHVVRLQWPVDCSLAGEGETGRLFLVANGAGPKLAAEAVAVARGREKFDAVISTGYCGALSPRLHPGDIFVASRVRVLGEDIMYPARMPLAVRRCCSGTLLSGDMVIQTAREKAGLRATGADAVDMEAGAVAASAAEWNLPFFCVRAVTDGADEDFAFDLNAARHPCGRFHYSVLVRQALAEPRTRLPELVRLWLRARRATRALGDFFVDCRF